MSFLDPEARVEPSYSEAQRHAELADHDASGLDGDARLADVTRFAARLCETPISLVSIVEDKRQWFPARTGLTVTETPRETSFCAHAMGGADIFLVPDASVDPRFEANPLVVGEPNIRFYAGAPIKSDDGVPLGALCVIDSAPRPALTDLQRDGLRLLAANVMQILSARRSSLKAASDRDEQEERFRVLADTMPQMVWSTRPDGFHDYYNARWYEFTGMPPGSTDGEGWNEMFHPDDRERAWATWRHSLETGEPYEIEYRLRDANGRYRWTLGRALPIRAPDGTIKRWFGTCTDIHDQKQAAQQQEIIAHELSHRIKNIFAVVGGLVNLTARRQPEFKQQAHDLRDRIMALGRAHDFVRPHSERSRPTALPNSLHGMLCELLKPYRTGDAEDKIVIAGEDVAIDDRSATPLALTFHELATNACKYGSLSSADGRVELAVGVSDSAVDIRWAEIGGPKVVEPASLGFGSELLALSAVRQLDGSLHHDWREDGLVVEISVPKSSMHRT